MKKFVVSAIGEDQPGIVSAVTEALYKLGCNLEDTSMTILEHEFAMILIVAGDGKLTVGKIEKAFAGARRQLGLTIFVKELSPLRWPKKHLREREVPSYILSVSGADNPGIVYKVTRLLASKKINITDLSSKRVGNREKPVYLMFLEMVVSPELKRAALEKELGALARKIGVEIRLRPIESQEL